MTATSKLPWVRSKNQPKMMLPAAIISMPSANDAGSNPSKTAAKVGIGFGTALAITISWSANKSILWAILHGILSWIYVIYYALKHR